MDDEALRVLEWYDLTTRKEAGSEDLKGIDLDGLRQLFHVSPDGGDPLMYHDYPVETRHVPRLQLCVDTRFDFSLFDYYIAAYSKDSGKDVEYRPGTPQIASEPQAAPAMPQKQHCCETMTYHINYRCALHPDPFDCGDSVVFYSNRFDEYGLIVHDGGSSVISIAFCPWCGRNLPESKRDRASASKFLVVSCFSG